MKVTYTPGEGIAVTFVGRGRRWELGIDEADELAGKLRRAVEGARGELDRQGARE